MGAGHFTAFTKRGLVGLGRRNDDKGLDYSALRYFWAASLRIRSMIGSCSTRHLGMTLPLT